jgi:UDP-glucose 4-epimerase
LSATGLRRVLVTGGAGFIGAHVVRNLLAQGAAATILDDLSTGTRAAVPAAARLVIGDVRDPVAARDALAGVDAVAHLAAKVSVRGSFEQFYDDVETNVLGTANLLRCLDGAEVRRFVLASSMAVYAESDAGRLVGEDHPRVPLSPYGVGKLSAEMLCGHVLGPMGIGFTALRYFNTFGAGQRFTPYVGVITIFVTRLLRGEPPLIFGDGQQRRDFVHVEDIAAGTIAALQGQPGTYNLGSGVGTTVRELAELLTERIAPGTEPAWAPAQEGELRHSVADIGRAAAALAYRPRRTLSGDIDAVIESIRARGDG